LISPAAWGQGANGGAEHCSSILAKRGRLVSSEAAGADARLSRSTESISIGINMVCPCEPCPIRSGCGEIRRAVRAGD